MPEKLQETQIDEQLKQVPSWERDGEAIKKTFTFSDFMEALEFVNRVGELAEERDHHPDIDIRYRRVTLALSTHSEGGLTEKDFELARAIESL